MHLWRHQNGIWYVRFGPRLSRRISTQSKDRREADQFLARFIATEGEPEGSRRTVGDILLGYMAAKTGKVRAPEAIRFAVKGLYGLHDLFPYQLTPQNIARWAGSRGASNGTILREVGVIRAAMSWAVENQWLAAEPTISNPVPTPKSRRRWVTKEEARRLLAACREPHVRLFTMLGLMTVARSSAIFEARWDQVDFERRVIDYGEGHGNKHRAVVPLNDDMLKTLTAARLMACSDSIVEFRGQPITSIKNGFAAACRRAQIVGVTPHILRHSGATWMALDGVPIEEIARMLGDSVAVTEKIYAKWTPGYLRRAAGALQLSDAP